MPALILSLVLLCGVAIGTSAASGLQAITAYLSNEITITLDGSPQTLLDVNGNRVYPVVYNGTTYLPIRAVAGMVGLDVDWDAATQTVILGKDPAGVDLIDTYKAYYLDSKYEYWAKQYQTSDNKTSDISGVSCSHWIQLGFSQFSTGYTAVASFNLGGNHDTLTFRYYANGDITLRVLGDNNNVLGEYTVPGGQVAQTVTIPLFKTSQLTFEVKGEKSTNAYIFDAYLDAEQ